ncbi:MAG: hypothetical protein LBG21_02090 [Campylobacteraceae bacterium]|jgi:hypothetical protein|nr:hypothetical protein [Campylobacteraceae bacterium]
MALIIPDSKIDNIEAKKAIEKEKSVRININLNLNLNLKQEAEEYCFRKSRETGSRMTFTALVSKALEDSLHIQK